MELNATEGVIEIGEVASVGIRVIDAIGQSEGVFAVWMNEKRTNGSPDVLSVWVGIGVEVTVCVLEEINGVL